jgi:hypothetical protein
VETSDRTAYERWLETSRQLHRANLAFADGVAQCQPEARLLALAREVGQLQEDEGATLRALCVLRASRSERTPALWRSVARDRVRVSTSTADTVALGN